MPANTMWDPQARLGADPYQFAGPGQPPPMAAAPRMPGRPGTSGAFGDMLRRKLAQRMGAGGRQDIFGGRAGGPAPPTMGPGAGGPSRAAREGFAGAHPELML
jgi:hypothetical protein